MFARLSLASLVNLPVYMDYDCDYQGMILQKLKAEFR
jgi:hypothetical protein